MFCLLINMRNAYPQKYQFWERDQQKGNLTLDNLLDELSIIAAQEESVPQLTNIEISKKKADKVNNNAKGKKKPNNRKRITY